MSGWRSDSATPSAPRRQGVKKTLGAAAFSLLAAVLFLCSSAACGTRQLDEAIFYDGPRFKLKLARNYRNLFLHYNGEEFSVQCSSAETAGSRGHATQDEGWRTLRSGGALGSKSAQAVVERERGDFVVIDENTLVVKGTVFRVSFDACGSFAMWDPTTLPQELIDPVEKPAHCAPQGTGDCRYYDFHGDREPVYDELEVDPAGTVLFVVRSRSFRGGGVLRVESSDFGQTWRVSANEAAHPPTDE